MSDDSKAIELASVVRRELPMAEGLRRLLEKKQIARSSEEIEAIDYVRRAADQAREAIRSAAEADTVDAARRSQAEIRRHVDSYLKEHFEEITGQMVETVVRRSTEVLAKGLAAIQEQNVIALDRMASAVRSQMRAFVKGAKKGVGDGSST